MLNLIKPPTYFYIVGVASILEGLWKIFINHTNEIMGAWLLALGPLFIVLGKYSAKKLARNQAHREG